MGNQFRQYNADQLFRIYKSALDMWDKIKKFVDTHIEDKDLSEVLVSCESCDGYKGYAFNIEEDVQVILTEHDKSVNEECICVHSNFMWNEDDGSLKDIELIIPTIILENRQEYDAGKVNVLEMFKDQYTNILSESLFIHELVHYFQIKWYYNMDSVNRITADYRGFNIYDEYKSKAVYFNNELEGLAYGLQLWWDYNHDDRIKQLVDKYRCIIEHDDMYKEFTELEYKQFDRLYGRLFYYASNHTKRYILGIINKLAK